jgi:hypothetical protein
LILHKLQILIDIKLSELLLQKNFVFLFKTLPCFFAFGEEGEEAREGSKIFENLRFLIKTKIITLFFKVGCKRQSRLLRFCKRQSR